MTFQTDSDIPRKVDEGLAALYYENLKLWNRHASALAMIHHQVGDKRVYGSRGAGSRWQLTDDEAIAIVAEQAGQSEDRWSTRKADEALTALEQVERDISTNEAITHEEEKRYTGWSRFFLVTSSPGHIHSSMHCSSCYATTTYGWLPQLSGKSEAEAVEACGPNLCTVCFPSAPVEHQGGKLSEAQANDILAGKPYESVEDRRAKKAAERQAKNEAKALRAYERACKLMAKVEAAYEALGGVEAVRALPEHGEGSLYSIVYGDTPWAQKTQQTVKDVLLEDQREARGDRRYDTDPRRVIETYERDHEISKD